MSAMEAMHDQAHRASPAQGRPPDFPLPVSEFEPNRYGIRGLEGNVREWTRRSLPEAGGKRGEQGYSILPQNVERHPWEAFDAVGFRTVLSVQ